MELVGFISILLFTDLIQTCLNSQVLPEAGTLLFMNFFDIIFILLKI